MIGLVIVSLLGVTLGGFISVVLDLGHGSWGSAINTLLLMVLLDGVGVWLLRGLRER